jgi:hypothetical protein
LLAKYLSQTCTAGKMPVPPARASTSDEESATPDIAIAIIPQTLRFAAILRFRLFPL